MLVFHEIVKGFQISHSIRFCRKLKKNICSSALGTVCVLISFPFIFLRCLGCDHSDHWAQFFYYAPFVLVFQFGWAATQIAHMALINQLTQNDSEKTELSGYR